jgi:acyl dehydratase
MTRLTPQRVWGKFRVDSMRTTKREGWGIVVLPSEPINQRGEVVRLGEHRLMIPMRPPMRPKTGAAE